MTEKWISVSPGLRYKEDVPDDIWRCTAYDPHGIRRCYGDGIDKNEATDQCKVEIMDYLKVRPDLGPLDKWTLKYLTLPALPEGY